VISLKQLIEILSLTAPNLSLKKTTSTLKSPYTLNLDDLSVACVANLGLKRGEHVYLLVVVSALTCDEDETET
jgi:hypothetical protein